MSKNIYNKSILDLDESNTRTSNLGDSNNIKDRFSDIKIEEKGQQRYLDKKFVKYSDISPLRAGDLNHSIYPNDNDKINLLQDEVCFWRNLYVNQVKESLEYEETIKTLYEENKLNQEYIISLEDRLNNLLDKTNNITNNYHNNLKSLHKLIESLENNKNYDNNFSSNFMTNLKIVDDFHNQLIVVSEEKENIYSNLSLCRHQSLQLSIKVEEMQKKIVQLHQQLISINEVN